jgi:hypothetical protein
MSFIESLARLGVSFWVTIMIGLILLLRRERTDKAEK